MSTKGNIDEILEALRAAQQSKNVKHGVRTLASSRLKRREMSGPRLPSAARAATTESGDIDVALRIQRVKDFKNTNRGRFADVFRGITMLPDERMFVNALGFKIPTQSTHLQYVSRERNLEHSMQADDDSNDTSKTRTDIEEELGEFPPENEAATSVQRKIKDRTVQIRRDDESIYLRRLADQVTPYLADSDNVIFSHEVQGSIMIAVNYLQQYVFRTSEFGYALDALGYDQLLFSDNNSLTFVSLFAQLAAYIYVQTRHLAPGARTFKNQHKEITPFIADALNQIHYNFEFDGRGFRQRQLFEEEQEERLQQSGFFESFNIPFLPSDLNQD